jgi:hypothetical protein
LAAYINIDANMSPIINGVDPTNAQDIATKNYVDNRDAFALPKSGGTMSGAIAMGNNKITGLDAGTSSNDAVNYAQLQASQVSLFWLNPINDPDLINDTLTTPPVSPVIGDVYIAAATSGAWTTGHAYFHNGTSWVDLLGRAVLAGDRFGISMESATAAAGGLLTHDNQVCQIVSPTPGAITYQFRTKTNQDAVFVNNETSNHFGHQYTYRSDISAWVEFGGISGLTAGIGLSISGNTLSANLGAGVVQLPTDEIGIDCKSDGGIDIVDPTSGLHSTATDAQLSLKLDGSTLSKSSSGVKVASGGITDAEISGSAAIAYSKLAISSSVGATELGYVSGVTSAIQTQFTGKANVSLSNIDAVTAIPATTTALESLNTVNGVFASEFKVKTKDQTTSNSGSIRILSGNAAGAYASGGSRIRSGINSNATMASAATLATGLVSVLSGDVTGGTQGSTGPVTLSTGGIIPAGVLGNTGSATINTGIIYDDTSTGSTGSILVYSGENAGIGASGQVAVGSGNSDNVAGGNSGKVVLESGRTQNGVSGTLYVGTGEITSTARYAGDLDNSTSDKSTGALSIRSGLIANGSSSSATGVISMQSGSNSGSGATGDVTVASGSNSGSGNSGNLILSAGTVSSGTKGDVQLKAKAVTVKADKGLIVSDSSTPTVQVRSITGIETLSAGVSGATDLPSTYFDLSEVQSMTLEYEVIESVTGEIRSGTIKVASKTSGINAYNDTYCESGVIGNGISFSTRYDSGTGRVYIQYLGTSTNTATMKTFIIQQLKTASY